jgi:hypothetical protein
MSSLRLRSVGLVAALTLAAVAVSHHLVYLLAHGAGAGYAGAMTQRGHDAYWTEFLVVVGGAVLVTSIAAARQLVRLRRQATGSGPSTADPGVRHLAIGFLRLLVTITLLASTAFLVQENLELLAAGHAMPGLGAVTGDHAIALPVIGFVAAVIALVRALVEWRRDVLLARLRRPGRVRREIRIARRPLTHGLALRSHLDGSRNGKRAPPAGLATPA